MVFTPAEASANKDQGHAALVLQHRLHEQLHLRLDGGQAQGGSETAPLCPAHMRENGCDIRTREVQRDPTQHHPLVHYLHGDRRRLPAQYPTPQLDRPAVYLSALRGLLDRTSPQPLSSRVGWADLQNIKRNRNAQCSLRLLAKAASIGRPLA